MESTRAVKDRHPTYTSWHAEGWCVQLRYHLTGMPYERWCLGIVPRPRR